MGPERKTRWRTNVVSWLVVGLVIGTSILPIVDAVSSEGVKNFKYIHLWTSQDGETHIKVCEMQNFTLQAYSALPQYVRTGFGGVPTKMAFTELSVGFTQPLHSPPSVQFVTTLKGHWYIKTTDGSEYIFHAGEVLFQDNTKNSPADKVPQHYSGNVGHVPCQQFLLQLNRTAEVDHPCPF